MIQIDLRSAGHLTWWRSGLLGGLVLLVATFVKAVAAIPRFFTEALDWGELAFLPFAVFGMGFLGGVLAFSLRGLCLRLGAVGDAAIGMAVMIVFFLGCMVGFDLKMLTGEAPGRESMLLLGSLVGLCGGPWIGRDLRRNLGVQTPGKTRRL